MTQDEVERRLTTVFSADVVGYSRLMGADEEATLRTLNAYREVLDGLVASHHGRVVSSAGDSVLAEFTSVIESVRCAIEVQQELGARNAPLPEGRRMEFRIGINLGDVMVGGDDIFGDGVSVAARLQGLAEPGGIYVSRPVRDQIRGRLDIELDDLGRKELKNIAKPVHTFRLRLRGAGVAGAAAAAPVAGASESAAAAEPALPDKPSIAVLPFDNMSTDPEQEYFSDGITEDIITDLSKLSALFVIARNSAFAYKGKSVNVQDAGRELGVRYVLEGSVRKAANRVRITAQLIDASTGGHLWADRYDRDLEDIFAVQDEVTREIVEALKVRLKGRETFMALAHEANLEARALFERACELDPGYAPAYARLAQAYGQESSMRWGESSEESNQRAFELAQKAIALDETLPFAHGVLTNIYLWRQEHDKALPEAERWVALDPNEADGYLNLAQVLAFSGRPEEALAHIEHSMRLNPHYSFLTLFALGHEHFMLHRYEEAADAMRRGIARNAAFMPNHAYLAACYAQLGRIEEAQAALDNDLPQIPAADIPYKNDADRDHFRSSLEKAGFRE